MIDAQAVVGKRHDDWIEVPAQYTHAEVPKPLRLRPGADEHSVRIDSVLMETEVGLVQLRQGLALIEEEHQR
jgi:hypothetical protein